jgi:hypothetical protein
MLEMQGQVGQKQWAQPSCKAKGERCEETAGIFPLLLLDLPILHIAGSRAQVPCSQTKDDADDVDAEGQGALSTWLP